LYSQIENPINTSCPINLDVFNEESEITQIVHCGHIFNRNSLRSWFQNNVRCPVCRYDIRESVSTEDPHPAYTPASTPVPTSESISTSTTNAASSIPANRLIPTNGEITTSLSNLTENLLNQFFPSNTQHVFDPSRNSMYYDSSREEYIFEGFLRR
jgi:hypothetical protein